ncbi:MAG: protein kinase, partial [Acidobacteriaceae bacterium]|nr:protein kinase [Acidobacteriaceae bacterium]
MSRRIGRYEIQALIGQGGFGQVFRAFDPTVGRQVAIKTITSAGDPELIQRFRNEAAASGRLRHQNIVIIYDFGEDQGSPYLVMELLDGEDLDRTIRNGTQLSLLEKLDIIGQSAAGLHHAHSHGVVHRDIKPANIMLQRDGVVKLTDFGIALLTHATAARLTVTGQIPGTVAYMAPEQLNASHGSDILTDIWSFGVTCYKLVTGTHPFQAESLGATVYRIVNRDAEPVRALNPECPEALEQSITKMLARDRDARYQSLEEVRFDLEPVMVELRKEQVHSQLDSARSLLADNRLDAVQPLLRRVLEADPGNRTARELREELQRKIRENEIKPKVAALLKDGLENMRTRKFDQAAKQLESALALDRSNAEIRKAIGELQAARERAESSDRLLQNAERALSGGDLTGAHKLIEQAVSTDPENAKAADLQQQVGVRILQRQRERHLEEELSNVRRLIFLESLDDASGRLDALMREYPESKTAADLFLKVRHEIELRERRQKLQAFIDDAKARIKGSDYAGAVDVLKTARADFPESAELRDLETFATEELAHQRQQEAVTRIISETDALAKENRFEDALQLVRNAVTEYPSSP